MVHGNGHERKVYDLLDEVGEMHWMARALEEGGEEGDHGGGCEARRAEFAAPHSEGER